MGILYQVSGGKIVRISTFKVAISAAIVLTGIISLNLATAWLTPLTIPSSGWLSIGYTSPLHVEGKYVKDEFGNTIYLRGICKTGHVIVPGGWWKPEETMYDYGYWEWHPEAVEYNLDAMKSLGFNVVRLFLPTVQRWLDNQDEGGNGITTRDEITYVIDQANQRGLYVMITPWTVKYTESGEQTAIPWDYYTDSDTGITYGGPGVFTKYGEQGILTNPEDFVNYWAADTNSLSAEYGAFPNVIYELWNEPNGWISGFDVQQMYFNVCQEVVNRLRAKGDEHIVVYQFGYSGMESNQALAWGQKLNGANIVYSIHSYRCIGGSFTYHFPNGEYQYEDVERILLGDGAARTYYVQNVIDNNLPLINTEIGACKTAGIPDGNREHEVTWFYNMLSCMNAWGFGYTAFEWYGTDVRWFGILEPNNVYPWRPPLNDAGEALVQVIEEGSPIP